MNDIKKLFPIFNQKIGSKKLVYLDSGATSQKPQVVLDAVSDYYRTYNANIHRGVYPIAEKSSAKVENVRQKVAKFINAKDPSEIIFTHGTTEGVNLIMQAWGRANIQEGDTIVTTIMEHHSNFVPWQQLASEKGAEFKVIDIDEHFQFPISNLKSQIHQKAKALAITYVSNMLGVINPIKELIAIARKANPEIVVVVDAAQAVPHMKVDVQDLDCDFLVFSGHKMLSETGIGVLYGKKKLLEAMPPFLFGGDMIYEVTVEKTTFAKLPNKFEAGTLNISGIVSLGAAIDFLSEFSMDEIREHEKKLVTYCIARLQEMGDVTIYGPTDDMLKRSGLVSFNLNRIHAHDVAQVLAEMNICVRAGHHCTMSLHRRLRIPASVRASFYLYNDKEDIDWLIEGLKKAKRLFSI